MKNNLPKYVERLLRETVPPGERDSSQRIARNVLGALLETMWTTNLSGNAPSTVRGCIDIAEVTAQADDPAFTFSYDPELLQAQPFKPLRTSV